MWPKGKSPLALTLRRMLDESNLFTRSEWSVFFDKNEGELEKWVSDEAVPDATELRSLFRVLEESTGVPREIILDFDALLNEPIAAVTSLAGDIQKRLRVCESSLSWFPINRLREYFVLPVLAGFLRSLGCYGHKDQEMALLEAGKIIRECPYNFGSD